MENKNIVVIIDSKKILFDNTKYNFSCIVDGRTIITDKSYNTVAIINMPHIIYDEEHTIIQ